MSFFYVRLLLVFLFRLMGELEYLDNTFDISAFQNCPQPLLQGACNTKPLNKSPSILDVSPCQPGHRKNNATIVSQSAGSWEKEPYCMSAIHNRHVKVHENQIKLGKELMFVINIVFYNRSSLQNV